MITDIALRKCASDLNVELAAIKAVAEVESAGAGFLPTGHPKILFEPHVFWAELKKRGINPRAVPGANGDILYEKWGEKPYGKVSAQPGRLERAKLINPDAALSSASWGRFQIMGYNWAMCGYKTLQDFINEMFISEDQHLFAFANFVRSKNLVDELQRHDWKGFALGYNGKGYKKNKYDEKLEAAYLRFKSS